MCTQPYCNVRIIQLIRVLYFSGGSNLLSSRFHRHFPTGFAHDGYGVMEHEVPIAMVALVAMAVSTYLLYIEHTNLSHNVTIEPTPPPEWDMNDNVKRLVSRARTLMKLRSNGEEDYEEEWANIGRMVSAEAFEFGLHAGEDPQEGARD